MFKQVCALFLMFPIMMGCSESKPDPVVVPDEQILAQAKGAILRANGPSALALLTEAAARERVQAEQEFVSCATDRLSQAPGEQLPDVSNPLVREIVFAFRTYWQEAIMNPEKTMQAELNLRIQLTNTLQIYNPGSIESTITERLQSEGFHVLMGRTGKLRELMIWRSQTEETTTVQLPEAEVGTNVIYMDDFVSTGWSSYFGCDEIGTGGWATGDGLYVVVPQWSSLSDERFRVSFLAHESQHFYDYSTFPELAGWELEYRAKLVELALADVDQNRLIAGFSANQGDDESDAHSYANRKVLQDLRAQLDLSSSDPLQFGSPTTIQNAADKLLRRDTQRRR